MTSYGSVKSIIEMVVSGLFPKILSLDTLLYLTSTFLMMFLTKFIPTARHDDFGLKVVFIGIPKRW
jgi:hypothetical protein